MPDNRGFRRSLFVLGIFCLLAVGCEDDPEIVSDGPATVGEVQFEVQNYELRYLELTDDDGQTIEYPDPVLAVYVEVTNVGEDEVVYEPQHDARELTEARHFMLYEALDQTEEIDWETFSPTAIPGVELQEGHWEPQLQDSQTLGADESIEDVLLFEPPERDDMELMLSAPPTAHRGDVPAFIQFDYSRPEPEGRSVYQVGDVIEFNGVSFQVTEIVQDYLELEDDGEEGFSDEPLLMIRYTIENESDDTIEYDARHDEVARDEGPIIQAGEADFARVRFPGSLEPVGQKGSVEIEPGESVEDFATFDRPTSAVDAATFVLPADYFGQSGTVRVTFSYTPEDVEEPEELQ